MPHVSPRHEKPTFNVTDLTRRAQLFDSEFMLDTGAAWGRLSSRLFGGDCSDKDLPYGFHKGWHRIAAEWKDVYLNGGDFESHWFFNGNDMLITTARTLTRLKVKTRKMPPTVTPSRRVEYHAKAIALSRTYDSQFQYGSQLLKHHLALVERDAADIGLSSDWPTIPDDAGLEATLLAINQGFDQFAVARTEHLRHHKRLKRWFDRTVLRS